MNKLSNTLMMLFFYFITIASVNAQDTPPGMKHVLKAEGLKKVRNYQGALLEYDNAIRLEPENYEYWLRKGNIYVMMKDWVNAVNSLNKVIEIKKNYVKVYMILLKIHMKNRNVEKAIEVLDKAYQNDPDPKGKTRYKIRIIRLLEKTKSLKKAGKHLQDAKQIQGEHPMVLYYDAKYSNMIGEYENATQSATTALKQLSNDEPQKNAGLYYELGYAYHQLGKYKESAKALRDADYGSFRAKIFKLTPVYFFRLATAYYQTFHYNECEQLLDKVLEMKKDYSIAHELKVKVAEKKSDQSLKIESLKTSIHAEKNTNKKAAKLAQLCMSLHESGKYAEALDAANQSLDLMSNNFQLMFLKSTVLTKLSKNDEAIALIKKLAQKHGLNQNVKAQYNFALGQLYESTGNTKLAIVSYKKARFGIFKYASSDRLMKLHQ